MAIVCLNKTMYFRFRLYESDDLKVSLVIVTLQNTYAELAQFNTTTVDSKRQSFYGFILQTGRTEYNSINALLSAVSVLCLILNGLLLEQMFALLTLNQFGQI